MSLVPIEIVDICWRFNHPWHDGVAAGTARRLANDVRQVLLHFSSMSYCLCLIGLSLSTLACLCLAPFVQNQVARLSPPSCQRGRPDAVRL